MLQKGLNVAPSENTVKEKYLFASVMVKARIEVQCKTECQYDNDLSAIS